MPVGGERLSWARRLVDGKVEPHGASGARAVSPF